jgi:hypothetical protein
MISFSAFLAGRQLQIAASWFPAIRVDLATGAWSDPATGASGTGAASLVAHGFGVDVPIQAG